MKILMLVGLLSLSMEAWAVEVGEVAPDFTLKSFEGENLRLEEHRGKVLLVNFWASWCGPCRQEMPILDRIHQRYEAMDFAVLGVNVDKQEKLARRVADKSGVSFPLLLDEGQSVSDTYDLKGMPYTLLIDRTGEVRYIHTGYKPGDERHYIDRLKALLRES